MNVTRFEPFRLTTRDDASRRGKVNKHLKGLILAQNERWRRGLGMQVVRQARKGAERRKGE